MVSGIIGMHVLVCGFALFLMLFSFRFRRLLRFLLGFLIVIAVVVLEDIFISLMEFLLAEFLKLLKISAQGCGRICSEQRFFISNLKFLCDSQISMESKIIHGRIDCRDFGRKTRKLTWSVKNKHFICMLEYANVLIPPPEL